MFMFMANVSPCTDSDKTQADSLENLSRRLYYDVMTKKSKNVEILWIAAEVL